MASEEDNFDIDIYGDGEGDPGADPGAMDYKVEENEQAQDNGVEQADTVGAEETEIKHEPQEDQSQAQDAPQHYHQQQQDEQVSEHQPVVPAQPAPQQGTKRKESSDDRPVDPGATNALMISDLHWWITEDDIRGWANEAGAEDELRELSFSEHKVNGKSKGFVCCMSRNPPNQC